MDSVYIALGIGLVLTFFLLSLLVSGLNEGVNRLFGVRSKFLWAYLRDVLDGPVDGLDGASSRMPARVLDVLWRVPRNAQPGGDPRPAFNPLPPPADLPASPTPPPPLADRVYERLRAVDQGPGRRTSLSNVPPNRFAVALLEIVAGEYDGSVDAFLAELKRRAAPCTARSPPYGRAWTTIWTSCGRGSPTGSTGRCPG